MRCIACGCTQERACAGGCSWVSVNPPKCSACYDVDGDRLGEADAGFAVGDPDGGGFGIEYCPASDVPAPHAPIFTDATTCYCARCKMDLAA